MSMMSLVRENGAQSNQTREREAREREMREREERERVRREKENGESAADRIARATKTDGMRGQEREKGRNGEYRNRDRGPRRASTVPSPINDKKGIELDAMDLALRQRCSPSPPGPVLSSSPDSSVDTRRARVPKEKHVDSGEPRFIQIEIEIDRVVDINIVVNLDGDKFERE